MTRHVGTTDEVLDAFMRGESMHTPAAGVPGGYRVSSVAIPEDDGEGNPRESGVADLYSYRTVVARRYADGRVAITTRRYSITTTRILNRLAGVVYRHTGTYPSLPQYMRRRELAQANTVTIRTAVPGRWGGYGPAWHPTGWDDTTFVVFGADDAIAPPTVVDRGGNVHDEEPLF